MLTILLFEAQSDITKPLVTHNDKKNEIQTGLPPGYSRFLCNNLFAEGMEEIRYFSSLRGNPIMGLQYPNPLLPMSNYLNIYLTKNYGRSRLAEYFGMAEALGIIATMVVVLYFSNKCKPYQKK